jgi:hypothetical protein
VAEHLGELAAALAKAQVAFPSVVKDKKVTVTTKTGGSYSFTYAPLDSILNAVRKPLADNDLVVVQMLDDGDLVTSLFHSSGGAVSGRVALPTETDIKAFGSAITYLRRYAIQAMLGIAAEDDDDGSRATGDEIAYAPKKGTTTHDGGLIGVAQMGKGDADWSLRQTPEGPYLAFRLVQGKTGYKVAAFGPLAEALDTMRPGLEGQRMTVWGTIEQESFTPADSKKAVTYQVVHAERIQSADYTLPAPDEPPSDQPAGVETPPAVAPGQEEAFDLSEAALS